MMVWRGSPKGISTMQSDFRISSLIPAGLAIDSVNCAGREIVVLALAESKTAICPLCGLLSRRIHSRYIRQVADLPRAGREVRLRVVTRRFICDASTCRRRVFAERFGGGILPERSRRTPRLECIVHHLGQFPRQTVVSRPRGTPSTSCNTGSRQSLPAGTAPQCCIRREAHPA